MALAVVAAVVVGACGSTTTLYSAEVITTEATRPTLYSEPEPSTKPTLHSEPEPSTRPVLFSEPQPEPSTKPTLHSQPEPSSGPSAIMAIATAPTGWIGLLDSPAAVPNGPEGVNPLGSEALTALPDPDPARRIAGPEEADASPAVERQGEAETLVGHAIVPAIGARSEPSRSATIISTHAHPTARGVPLVFQVLHGPVDGWVEVLLPVRPNGTTGWVPVEELEITRNRYRLDVDVRRHQLTVFRDGERLMTTKVAVGTGATPTPIGRFYLTELLRPPDPTDIYGPFAYGLSGFSETLDAFNGGPGIIGIHGTNRPDLLGTDVSHGCIRVDNDVISELATLLPLGTPIAIHRGHPTLHPPQPH